MTYMLEKNKWKYQLGSNLQKIYIVHNSRQNWSKHKKEDTNDRAESLNLLSMHYRYEIADNGAKHSLAPSLINTRRWAKKEKGRNNCIH